MFNPFVMKKYAALILVAMMTTVTYTFVTIQYGMMWGIVSLLLSLVISILIANLLLSNPYRDMVEGKGILTIDLNSTGVIVPFIVNLRGQFLKGKSQGQNITDIWDRSTVSQISPPVKETDQNFISRIFKPKPIAEMSAVKMQDGELNIRISKEAYNQAKFVHTTFPCLIWNSQIQSFLTKDMLSDKEKDTFAEHGILYLNRKMEELTSVVRDFGRYVVEMTRPKGQSIFANKWFWIIAIGFIVLLGFMFAPAIIKAVQGTMGGTATTVQTLTDGTRTIIPVS